MKQKKRQNKGTRLTSLDLPPTPVPPSVPALVLLQATNPYLTGMQQVGNTYSPYFAPSPIMPTIMGPADPSGVGSPLGVVPQTVAMPQKMPRTDRLEVCLTPANYMRAHQVHGPGPRAPPPPPPPQAVYQAQAAVSPGQPAQAPQSRCSPITTAALPPQCAGHNQPPSPTTASLTPHQHSSCTGAALSSVCAPLHPGHPGPLHSPLHNLVYVHAYYEGPYVPIYVRT